MPNFHLGTAKRPASSPFFTPYFFVVALILSVTAGLYLISAFTAQGSRLTLLVVVRGDAASVQAGPIIENLLSLSRKLSFYDRLLAADGGISDPYAGLGKDERKAGWDGQFEISRNGTGTMLDVVVYRAQRKDAERIARQFALTLAATAGDYYDGKEELEIRTVEGPITAPVVRSPYLVLLLSLLGGTAAAAFLFYLGRVVSSLPKVSREPILAWPEMTQERREEALDGKVFPHLPYFPEEAPYEPRFRRSAAPPNLPVEEELPTIEDPAVPEDLPVFDEPEEVGPVEPEVIVPPLKEAPLPQGEPTEEEYRQRLNKLLRGEM